MSQTDGESRGTVIRIRLECGHEGGAFADTTWIGMPRMCLECQTTRVVTEVVAVRPDEFIPVFLDDTAPLEQDKRCDSCGATEGVEWLDARLLCRDCADKDG